MKRLIPFFVPVAFLFACGGESEPKPVPEMQEAPRENAPQDHTDISNTPAPVTKKVAAADTHQAKANPTKEDELLRLITDLPEIRKIDRETREKTNNAHGLKTYISARPSDDAEYYTVAVAEDNGASLVTLYTFHVYPDYSIQHYDEVADKEQSLKKWRRSL